MEELKGKVAVITGAGRGIGKAIAIAYAKKGARVCCIARNQAELDLTVRQIQTDGGDAISIPCDVTEYYGLENAFSQINNKYKRIDVVVINAGIDCIKVSVENLEIDDWKNVIDVNLNGAFYTAKAAIPYLKKNGNGKIINIGSGMGHKGRADGAPYSCSKAGLWMLTRILAQELSEFNISVNELIPGPVITDMENKSMNDRRSAFSEDGEWVKSPEDVVDMALFLAMQPNVGPTAQSFSLMRRDL